MVCLALELVGPWVVLGFSVRMEAFDELLSVNVGDLISVSSPFLNPTWEVVLRWWRNRTGRPLSPPRIHQKNI